MDALLTRKEKASAVEIEGLETMLADLLPYRTGQRWESTVTPVDNLKEIELIAITQNEEGDIFIRGRQEIAAHVTVIAAVVEVLRHVSQ